MFDRRDVLASVLLWRLSLGTRRWEQTWREQSQFSPSRVAASVGGAISQAWTSAFLVAPREQGDGLEGTVPGLPGTELECSVPFSLRTAQGPVLLPSLLPRGTNQGSKVLSNFPRSTQLLRGRARVGPGVHCRAHSYTCCLSSKPAALKAWGLRVPVLYSYRGIPKGLWPVDSYFGIRS